MLYYPELAFLPPILDFEASSLSDTSYPISAGLIVAGYVHYWIIKPEPEWIDWSYQSQAVHGLRRSFIEEHGQPAQQVYLKIMGKLAGHPVVYSDAPAWERLWLQRLGALVVRIADIKELIDIEGCERFSTALAETFADHKLIQHRADHDVVAIALAVKKLHSELFS